MTEAQAAGFQLITHQWLHKQYNHDITQLLLVVDGAAGCGKTNIIKGYTKLLTDMKRLYTLRCAAYTGSAANNIYDLHMSLSLSCFGSNETVLHELNQKWR